MSKIIIHNHTDLSDNEVLGYIKEVVEAGKISKTSKGEQYCFVTRFKIKGITVASDRAKSRETYTFHIY